MPNPAPPVTPLCSICQKPVSLEACKTDHEGQAVHEGCYASRLSQINPPVTQR
jgi:hypothetical protein